MEFPIQDIDLINNGINSLSHYFNKFFDFCKPIEIAEPLKNLFETYKGEVKYRTTENKKWLVLISEELFKLEYIAKTNGFFMLEGTKKQPNDFETYLNIYIDAYNLCREIHDYFENVYPDEFSSWDDTTPVILTGIEYNNSQPQQAETETPTFINNFDKITPTEIYKHFKAGLVEKGYLTEQELNEYLKAAFEMKTIPETLFKIKDAPNKAAIGAVFYKYYKNVAGKIHGKQNQYAALLGDYFEGYKTTTVSSNFSKSVY